MGCAATLGAAILRLDRMPHEEYAEPTQNSRDFILHTQRLTLEQIVAKIECFQLPKLP